MKDLFKKELKVAFSKNAQHVWFRTLKYAVITVLFYFAWRKGYLWQTVGVLFGAAVFVHLLYRYKTSAWTRPWGGWDDPAILNKENDSKD